MKELFLLYINNFLAFLTTTLKTSTLAIICNSLVVYLTVLCSIFSIKKEHYTIIKRLWIVFDFVAICIIQFWLERQMDRQNTYLLLTIGSCFLGLSICLFLPVKKIKISQEKRMFAQFLDRCAHNQTTEKIYCDKTENLSESEKCLKASKVFSSPIISHNHSDGASQNLNNDKVKDEIDFSHIKGILAKLEYYPLKEQDKKSAKELENAILEAQENGLDRKLKQTINDGLGALLKIMAKYAV